MISASEFRTPIQFQRRTQVSDGAGGTTTEWAAIPNAPTRAKVEALSGLERLEAGRLNATTKERLTCRYFAGITAVDRVLVEGVPYAIMFVDDPMRRRQWLVCDIGGGQTTL
jgi:SPP1 family predicted phage head-tail adaptor